MLPKLCHLDNPIMIMIWKK